MNSIKYNSIKICYLSAILLGANALSHTEALAQSENKEAITHEEQIKLDELKLESEIGRNMAGRLLTAFSASSKPKLVEYVNSVGNYIAQKSDYPERKFMFEILPDKEVAAYSCPGGYIFISEGALKFAKNEAELGAVLAHEIAHIGKQHVMQALNKKIATQKNLQPDPEIQAREREKNTGSSSKFTSALAYIISGPSAGSALNVLNAAKGGLAVLLKEGLTHEFEYEADKEGLKYLMQAGYSGKSYLEYLTRLAAKQKKITISNMEKTHPPYAQRIKLIKEDLAKISSTELKGALGKERFAQVAGVSK